MPGNSSKVDIRVTKTNTAILGAIARLIEKRKFANLTVNDICKEALVSRATFYAHFDNKYDCFRCQIAKLEPYLIDCIDDYGELEATINGFVRKYSKSITNVIEYADNEMVEIVLDFISSAVYSFICRKTEGNTGKNTRALSEFYAGGIYSLLVRQVKSRFPEKKPLADEFFRGIIDVLIKCNSML